MRRYTVVLVREEDAYTVTVPALPGCNTFGATRQEALEQARDAISLYLEELAARGEPIPADVTPEVTVVDVAERSEARSSWAWCSRIRRLAMTRR